MKKAFTLIELVVAVGILAMVLSFASVIFRVSIGSHRTAVANTEIMQKLRAITDQLNADFKGLRKDGEIFVAWVATTAPAADPTNPSAYERFDRIMFFSDGDFQSYGTNPMVRGNVARVCYMLAKQDGVWPYAQDRERRILARTQHILTDDSGLADFLDPATFTTAEWFGWNNRYEYDKISLEEWKNRFAWSEKVDMLSVITAIRVEGTVPDERLIGAVVNPANPDSIHMLVCEGVGEFKVQGWHDGLRRWIPEVDPDGDGSLADTDFFLAAGGDRLDPEHVPGVLYPYPPFGAAILGGQFECDLGTVAGQQKFLQLQSLLNQQHFNEIPGLGRALKFTFTLYDSKGIIEGGRTFTHIVYLGN
jgi:prepilin-type N-terminal cleavage/methylation domain-containing protein